MRAKNDGSEVKVNRNFYAPNGCQYDYQGQILHPVAQRRKQRGFPNRSNPLD
jgi:hypothetical protein